MEKANGDDGSDDDGSDDDESDRDNEKLNGIIRPTYDLAEIE